MEESVNSCLIRFEEDSFAGREWNDYVASIDKNKIARRIINDNASLTRD